MCPNCNDININFNSTVVTACSCEDVSPTQSTPNNNNGCCVVTVNGKDGIVNLTTTDIGEGLNLYFTTDRARQALSALAPIEYNSATGQISHKDLGPGSGVYGSNTQYPILTLDNKGHIVGVSLQTVTSNSGLDGDLLAIADLNGTGYLVRVGNNQWALRYLLGTAGRIAVANPTGTPSSVIDLAPSGVTAGQYGSSTQIPKFTVDDYGRITAVTLVSVTSSGSGATTLGGLGNVDDMADAPATLGSFLIWNGTQWEASTNGVFVPFAFQGLHPASYSVALNWFTNARGVASVAEGFNTHTAILPLKVKDYAYQVTLGSGIIDIDPGANVINGVDTNFTTEFSVGDKLCTSDGFYIGEIDVISSDTTLQLVDPANSPGDGLSWSVPIGIVVDNTIKLILDTTSSQYPDSTYLTTAGSSLIFPTSLDPFTNLNTTDIAPSDLTGLGIGMATVSAVEWYTPSEYEGDSYIYDYSSYIGINNPDSGGNSVFIKPKYKVLSITGLILPPKGKYIYLATNTNKGQHSEGWGTFAGPATAHSEGLKTKAGATAAHSEGYMSIAAKESSHAEGYMTQARGVASHSEGIKTIADEAGSHSEGIETEALFEASHSEGTRSRALANSAHAEGTDTEATGTSSHAEGVKTKATQDSSHAEGYETESKGLGSHSEGNHTHALDKATHSEGINTYSMAGAAHSQGMKTLAYSKYTHSEGEETKAGLQCFRIEAIDTPDDSSDTVGIYFRNAQGPNISCNPGESKVFIKPYLAQTEDIVQSSLKFDVVSYGYVASGLFATMWEIRLDTPYNYAYDNIPWSVGDYLYILETRNGVTAHAEGLNTLATNKASHSQNENTIANGRASNATGQNTIAVGEASTTKGILTIADGVASEAGGIGSTATHKGEDARASGYISHIGDAQTMFLDMFGSGNMVAGGSLELKIANTDRIKLEPNSSYYIDCIGSVLRVGAAQGYYRNQMVVTVITDSSGVITHFQDWYPAGVIYFSCSQVGNEIVFRVNDRPPSGTAMTRAHLSLRISKISY